MTMVEDTTSTIERGVSDIALFDAIFNKKADAPASETPPRAPDGKFAPKNAPPEANEASPAVEEPEEAETSPEAVSDDPDKALQALLDLDPDYQPEEAGPEFSDDTEMTIKVDGESYKVTLKDLKDNYSGEKAIAKRIQQVTETKQIAEQQATHYYNTNKEALNKLQHLDKIIGGLSQPNINWEELKTRDPLQYALKREDARDWQDKQRQVQMEIGRVNSEQAALQAQAKEDYLNNQAEALVRKLPDMADPSKASVLMGRFKSAAKEHYDFTAEEVDSVMDHRQLMVLHDAVKYRELVARKAAMSKGVIPVAPTRTVKTVAAGKSAASSEKNKEAAMWKKARETGKVDDVANLLMVRKR